MQNRFSLVELLVVAALLGLMAATLLPALQSARRHGQAAQCQEHLRQLGGALHLYAADHGGALPGSMPHGNGTAAQANVGWDDVLAPGLGAAPSLAQMHEEHPDLRHGLFQPSLRLFACPADPAGAVVAGPGGALWAKRSYLLNTYSLDGNSPRDPLDKGFVCERIAVSGVEAPAGTREYELVSVAYKG